MNTLCISVDSTTPVTDKEKKQHNILSVPLTFLMDGEVKIDAFVDEDDKQTFYENLRQGAIPSDTQVIPEAFTESWKDHLQAGQTILHLSTSAKLGSTYDSACYARDLLSAEFLEKIKVVNTHVCGYNVTHMAKSISALHQQGATDDDLVVWINEHQKNYNMLLAIEDIQHMRQAGRISHIRALLSATLGIRPVLYLSPEGNVELLHVNHGQNRMVDFVIKALKSNATDDTDWVYVQHGGDEKMANELVEQIKAKTDYVNHFGISVLSPILGVQTGPSALAVYFKGRNRKFMGK